MRHIYHIMIMALMLVAISCKPTEKNYREAYDRAVAGREAAASEDSTIYHAIRREMRFSEVKVDGISYPINIQYVSVTKDGGGIREYIKKYLVVAGQFKQVLTAKSMRERLVENGYPGAFVVHTAEPYYYVIAASYSDIRPAIEMYDKLKGDASLKLKAPIPFLLCPAQIKS